MKKIVTYLMTLLFITSALSQNILLKNKIVSNKDGIKVSLPIIENMVECYDVQAVHNYFDFVQDSSSNHQIAFYIDEGSEDQLQNLNTFPDLNQSFSFSRQLPIKGHNND